jgi:hypothetical protein
MATQATTTRRALFAAAVALPTLAFAGGAVAHSADDHVKWSNLASQAHRFDPARGLATVATARRIGMDIDHLTGMHRWFFGERHFVLTFQDAASPCLCVDRSGLFEVGAV